MTARIQVRRDTSANWTSGTPPTLSAGEIGLDTVLNQVKVGDGSSNWTALPWLGGSLPSFSGTSTSLDDAGNKVNGLYRFTSASALTPQPTAPEHMLAADGGASMLVLVFGSIVIQNLWTDGDGAQPQKSYTRIFDTAWRSWYPDRSWVVSDTEGTHVRAMSLTVGKGLLGTPSVTTWNDLDTGLFWNAANNITVVTNGAGAITVGSSQGVVFGANIQVPSGTASLTATTATTLTVSSTLAVTGLATLNAGADMGNDKVTNVANPTAAQDAVTKNYLEADRIGQTAHVCVLGGATATIPFQVVGIASSGFTIVSQSLRAPSGTWKGVAVDGNGNYSGITVTNGSAPVETDTGQGTVTSYVASNFFRVSLTRTA